MNPSTFVPSPHPNVAPYWEATKEQRLVIQRCSGCRRLIHHPREACPTCLDQDMDWVESTGAGTVHAISVHHRPFGTMTAEDCPYVVVFVDLDEGVRVLSNLIGADAATAQVGDRVELAWRPAGEGFHLPQFQRTRS